MLIKIFLYILKAHTMLYIITKFRDSRFSQSEVKAEGRQFCPPPKKTKTKTKKPRSKKPTQNRVKQTQWMINIEWLMLSPRQWHKIGLEAAK